jgi:putative ABC transport system ATP-binding protein
MSVAPIISVANMRFGYSPASRDPAFELCINTLELTPGERLAVIGPSGSGKTTLLHLIAGIVTPSQGTIHVLGQPMSALPELRRRALRLQHIGMVFQEFELLEYLSALDNIVAIANIASISPRTELLARAENLAQDAGIAHVLSRKPRKLSQGERQRVALCRALVARPALLLCDEPTGNLDPDSTASVLELLLEHARTCDASVMMVTHNHGVLHRFDRVLDITQIARRVAEVGA